MKPRQEMMAEGPQMTQMRSLRSNRSEQVRLFPTFGWSSFLEKPEIAEGKRVPIFWKRKVTSSCTPFLTNDLMEHP